MSPRWAMGLALIFIILGGLSTAMDGMYFSETHTIAIFEAVEHFRSVNILNPVSTFFSITSGLWDVARWFGQVVWWDYAFLKGDFVIVAWIFRAITMSLFIYLIFDLFRLKRAA